MLSIHVAVAPRRALLNDRPREYGPPRVLIRASLQAYEWPLFYEMETREAFVCVPHKHWREYHWEAEADDKQDRSGRILHFSLPA